MQIRQFTESDLESVLDSWEVATRLAHQFMTDGFIAQERKNVAEMYLPNTDTWVAEVNGEVKGFIALMGNEVGAIFLQPNCHGKGIGKALWIRPNLSMVIWKSKFSKRIQLVVISIQSMALSS